MYITPIDGAIVENALPERAERSPGVFAWGMPRLRARRYVLALFETGFVFVGLPILALNSAGGLTIPLIMMVMLSSTAILLSATKSFHWADLLPVDFWSEWRLMAGCGAVFALIAFVVTSIYWPSRLFSAPPEIAMMLLAFPFVTALPMELVYRALLFRRYGHLIRGEATAIVLGAGATALGYTVLSGGVGGIVFGFALGGVLGWAYLRTGNFLVSIILHWAAVASLYLIGPGFL